MTHLFDPLTLAGTTFAHRAWISPMCQYSADPGAEVPGGSGTPGLPDDWHLAHLGSFAVGGAALVVTEASAVSPEGRITPWDTGLWNDEQQRAWARVVRFLHARGARAGVQLAHAGRKGSTHPPFHEGRGSIARAAGGWRTVGPTDTPFGDLAAPTGMDEDAIDRVVGDFAAAARRAVAAGFDVVELHAAHGYQQHQFLSPLSNTRADRWGGGLTGRTRLLLEVVDVVRAVLPSRTALFVRVSATDWTPGGWDLDDTVALARLLRERGVDLLDCSSGGNVPDAAIPVAPRYQLPAAVRVRREVGLATAAVGLVTTPAAAEGIVAAGEADAVLVGRAALRDPRWVQRAAEELGADLPRPPQYLRAW